MKKVGDDKFVIQNIERELTINYFDKRYWIVYIEFLKEKSHWKWLLDVYSRYCRLFIDDLEMRKQYQNEIENIEKTKFDVKTWKIDLIKIENDFGSAESALKLMKNYFGKHLEGNLEVKLKLTESESDVENLTGLVFPEYAIDETGFSPFRTTIAVSFEIKTNQIFGLPSNLIYSILQKCNPIQLQKFHSSSKQLYLMTNIRICHRCEFNDFETTVSFEQSLFISINDYDIQIGNAKKLYLTNSLLIYSQNKNRNLLTEFIPKIYKCTVRFLTLQSLDIKINDFDCLVQNVEKLLFIDSTVVSNGKYLSITEIIDRMPKVSYMNFLINGTLNFNHEDSEFQSHNEKLTKINYLHIRTIHEVEDPLKICSFIWKNAAPNSHFYIELETTQEYVENLDDLMKIEFNKWIPENEKPCIIIRNEITLNQIQI
uniref:F-box domain-containing protein n=1 Tax=Panagrolaimus sp. ES5 TaxID=591445 RepID=A0AC34GXD6_9BILA